MDRRRSIYIPGFRHKNPIPNAAIIGDLLMSGVINGVDPATGELADGLDDQCRFMFAHVRAIVEAAGGTTGDILKITVWMRDRSKREALNREWLAMFPDEASRPARHSFQAELEGRIEIQCDVTAVIGGAQSRPRSTAIAGDQ
ncbi:RidA family protein [Mesorhizobium sp. CU2]|uniref:RidA family protein n=1 Tax=unclassified Mesorhizobium TaxID=325217 RepID=UPI00112C5F45|nr:MULTISPECIES: RidA family protein [unclassified Mesorhizobium]TPN85604.1 RidA family protein [Mesorhizobium sp. CU3]TPO10282.1 RidA family protein [Mesorhizobium sp. CU2]